MNNNLKKKSKKRAFTLIELIVVIAILGVFAAILVPSMTNLIGNARTQTAVANARTIYSVASAEAAFDLANGNAVTDGTYDSSDESGFFSAVSSSAGQFDGSFEITVENNVVTSVEYTMADEETIGTYPTE